MTHFLRLLAGLSLLSPVVVTAEPSPIRVLVWDERQPAQKEAYGGGYLGDTIAAHLAKQPGLSVKSVALDAPDQGLDVGTLDTTDVIVWWGHVRHQEVTDARAADVAARVRDGRLGLVPLHSAHWAKPFVRLMQDRAKADAVAKVPEAERATAQWEFLNDHPIGVGVKADTPLTPALSHRGGVWTLSLPQCVFPSWRADGAPGRMTTRLPAHPIAAGLPEKWDVLNTEMYNEPFHVPEPDAVVFEERWDKGEFFRSGCAWQVGKGRVFYFRPGHESYAVYRQINCLKVIDNAVRWASPTAAAAAPEK